MAQVQQWQMDRDDSKAACHLCNIWCPARLLATVGVRVYVLSGRHVTAACSPVTAFLASCAQAMPVLLQVEFTFGYSLPLERAVRKLSTGQYELALQFSPAIAGLVVRNMDIKVKHTRWPLNASAIRASTSPHYKHS